MNDPDSFEYRLIWQLNTQRKRFDKQVGDIPALYLPWTQRVVNPYTLALSGGISGDQTQPWPVRILAFYVSVFVVTTNNGTNFWTLDLISGPGGTTIASVNTSGISANNWTRLSDLTITQPASTDAVLHIRPTATLAPGDIYITPAVALLRT